MNSDAKTQTPVGWDLLDRSFDLIQAGDIVQMQEHGVLSCLVRWFTTRRGKAPSWASHSALVLTADPAVIVIEARLQVAVRPLATLRRNRCRLVVHRRPGGLTSNQRRAICLKALEYEGRWYGGFKVLMQALDHAIGDRYLFRRLALMDDYPICSWLVAYVYDRVLGLKFGMEPNAAAPNDILAYCVKSGWELVWADTQATVEQCTAVTTGHRPTAGARDGIS